MGTILNWGYIDGYNSYLGYIDGYNLDLGVCEYSKVENPCLQMFKYLIFSA